MYDEKELRSKVARCCRAFRLKHNYSQSQMAKKFFYAQQTISLLEADSDKVSLRLVLRMAQMLENFGEFA